MQKMKICTHSSAVGVEHWTRRMLVGLLLGIVMCAWGCGHKDTLDAARVAAMQEKVQAMKLESEKYAALKGFAETKTPEAKAVLLDAFKSLPPSYGTTDPNSDGFKARVFELILPVLKPSEKRKFILQTLDAEIASMRYSQSRHFGNMYPVVLWRKIITAVEADGDFSVYNEKFSSMARDMTLPEQFREDTLAKCEQYKARNTPEAKIIANIIRKLNPKPESFVPWEYYNDPEKRRAYCLEGVSYANMLKRSSEWRMAGQEVKYEADLKRLRTFGLKAVEQILPLLEKEDVSTERRDALAEVASELFSRLQDVPESEQGQADVLVEKLRAYINKMEDKGAFCHRYYTMQGLSVYYRNIGKERAPPPKSGWAPKAMH